MTKEQLKKENKELKKIIDFYFEYEDMSLEELIEKIKRQKKINEKLIRILMLTTIVFLCASFYLLGLAT